VVADIFALESTAFRENFTNAWGATLSNIQCEAFCAGNSYNQFFVRIGMEAANACLFGIMM